MYKAIEKLAWLTGSLSVIGVVFILFLYSGKVAEPQEPTPNANRHFIKLSATGASDKKTESSKNIITESDKTDIAVKEPASEIIQPEPEIRKEELPKKREIITEPVKPKEKERKPVVQPEREPLTTSNTSRLFADSELHQLVGKIQAANIRNNAETNCIQLRITADNNNMLAVAQVERFLAARNYIIIGREKEDFLRGSGLKVNARGKCLNVTVGRK